MTDVETTPAAPPPESEGQSAKTWAIAFAVIAAVLGVVLAVVLLRNDDTEDTATTDTTETTATPTSPATEPTEPDAPAAPASPTTSPATEIVGPECSAAALMESIDAGIAGDDATVVDFECTPGSASDRLGGDYAWALVEAPDTDAIIVLFAGYQGDGPDGGPATVDWRVLTYGSDVACEDELSTEVCDALPRAPSR
jgi:hypothetical protein